jgi:hypothetical protein
MVMGIVWFSLLLAGAWADLVPDPLIPPLSTPDTCQAAAESAPSASLPVAKPIPCPELEKVDQAERAVRDRFFATSNRAIKAQLRSETDLLEKRSAKLAAKCRARRFASCSAQLNPTITKDTLDRMFAKFKRDPRLRYASGGGGACALRAEALSFILAEAGYAAQSVRIEHSPTLIAMDRDANDRLVGTYDDYNGFHSVVQILVEEGGKSVPYILDTQYMRRALPRDEYFVRTMGQPCRSLDEGPMGSYLNCYFRLHPQNWSEEKVDAHAILDPGNRFTMCGWGPTPLHEDFAQMAAHTPTQAASLVKTNGWSPADQAPEWLARKPVNEETSKALIIDAFERYTAGIQEKLEILPSLLDESPEAKVRMRRQLEADSAGLAERVRLVRKNVADLKTD